MSTSVQTWRSSQPTRVQLGWLGRIHQVLAHHLWLLLFPLAIPALLPFYTEGLPRSFDGGLHLLRISLLDRYIGQGFFFPRWAPELLLGHGYPLFNYYAPGSYYLVELLHLLGLDLYPAFVGAFAIFVVGGGIGVYLLAQDLFGRQRSGAALVAAVAYIYGPYLLTNVFIRGAIAEAGAQAILPWVFWTVRRLLYAKQPARAVLPVVFCLGALAITHNITLLFAPPVLLGYIVLHWWRGGRRGDTLVWSGVALVGAMGVSAFFWLPVLLERSYLADTSLEMMKAVWLPGNVWKWENFLDRSLLYNHTFVRPLRLGLVQLVLGLSGFVLALRRDGEWFYWGLVALCAGLMMSAPALPLWLSNDILVSAQFTWRLLSILSLPLALFAGGLVYRLPPGWLQTVATAALIGLIIWSQTPRLQWMDVFDAQTVDLSLPVFLQAEVDKDIIEGGTANSSIQEFRPRWAAETLTLEPVAPDPAEASWEVSKVNTFGLEATVNATTTTTLRLNEYYFPGWRVVLDGERPLPTYPSTNLGLLTADVPPGEHTVQVTWAGTTVHWVSSWLSLATLLLLFLLTVCQHGLRRAAALPLFFLTLGLVVMLHRPALAELTQAAQPVEADGLRLLGFEWERRPDSLYLYPYWEVKAPQEETLRVRWQLQDRSGRVLVDLYSHPYFNSYRASNFPVDTLVDDAYRLPLPPGLPAGEYWLAVQLGESYNELIRKPVIIGEVELIEGVPLQEPPRQRVHMQVSNQARLIGFELDVRGRRLVANQRQPAVVQAGAYLRYLLYWQALRPVTKNYHGFVHLVDVHGQPLAQQDQLPGPLFQPPLLWDAYRHVRDAYLLRVPDDAPSGLYWPAVGMYDFATLDRLPLYIDDNTDLGYDYRLPPVKVLNPPTKEPDQPLEVGLGELGALLGYDLSLASPQVRPGEPFQITLYYRANQPSPLNLTRFLHLHDAERGMAAQQDSQPQDGLNPTWVWQPGEVVADTVELVVAPEAVPGDYTLYVGFYDPANGERIPLTDQGQPALDNRAILTTLTVTP